MSLAIVPIALTHAAAFRAALDVVAREKKYLAMVEAPPLEQVEAFVRSNVERGIAQFVAVQNDRVLAWADIVPSASHGIAHRGSLGMGVLPEFRGRGLGRAVLNACIAKAWTNGLERVDLEVRADNSPAIQLYTALGFRREGIKERGMRVDGAYFETVLMGLLRDEA
ncbi:MAG: GNAT family N-acetyltransferase [Burkholderiaceae bacterium]